MKKVVVLLFVLLSAGAFAQGIKTPAPSPTQTLKQDFALSSIEITYSRPVAKGRKIFGDLVPFGKIWRTGANAATKVTFGEDVKVGGMPVKAGSYAIYSVPTAGAWEIIINKGANNSGLTGYKTEDDVARFKVESMQLPMMIENFTIILGNLTASSADIQILWENTAVQIPVVADIDTKIMAQISLNSDQPGAGSRATVQQSLYIPISAPWTPPVSAPAPQPEPAECTPIEWRTQFGNITPAQLKAISTTQAQNGLTSVSQPSRTVYWIDSPLTWTQSLGTNSSPVVLIFSDTACALQCPQIASQAAITGMVYFQSANACQNPVALHTLNAEAYHFDWPIGIDASKVQRVSGSWKNAGF